MERFETNGIEAPVPGPEGARSATIGLAPAGTTTTVEVVVAKARRRRFSAEYKARTPLRAASG